MAKLGDAFSEQDRRKSAVRQLVPGCVLYLDVALAGGRKSKFLVVASVDSECCTFVVNSRVHPFIETRPDLAVCQVRVDAARHLFLRRDSWVGCHELVKLRTDAVVSDLVADIGRIKGHIHRDVVIEIVAAVKRAPTLSADEQTRLAEALERASR